MLFSKRRRHLKSHTKRIKASVTPPLPMRALKEVCAVSLWKHFGPGKLKTTQAERKLHSHNSVTPQQHI